MKSSRLLLIAGLFASLTLSQTAAAAYERAEEGLVSTAKPKEFEGIGIDEQLGKSLDLTVPVKDETGKAVPLSTYFHSGKPVILSLVYFDCPGLCNYHLNGLSDGMKKMDWQMGDKFEVISMSFDSRETTQTAVDKKESYIKAFGKPEAAKAWHFITADEPVVKSITSTAGFKYRWDEKNKDWAHASAAIILTPDGKISRYLHGVFFEPKDLKFALLEASNGQIGTLTDRLVYYCYQYDAHKSAYSLMAMRLVQIAAVVVLLLLGIALTSLWLRGRKQSHRQARLGLQQSEEKH